MSRHRRVRRASLPFGRVVAAVFAVSVLVAAVLLASRPAARPVADGAVLSVAEECQRALGYAARSAADRVWLRQCVHALTPPTSSPSPTLLPPSPTPGSTTPPPSTPPPTPTPSLSTTPPPPPGGECPAWPSTPDANCTGYRRTGVTLHDCSNRITTPGIYDSCRFTGNLTIQSTGVTVRRSLVDGGHVESVYPGIYDLQGVVLEDVQILGGGDDGSAAVGNNDYTCRRCDVSGGNRGFAVGNNVLIVDSYAHDFWIQPVGQQGGDSAHQTAISTHGGSGVRVVHSTLRCNSDAYACSAGFSFYSEDAPGIDDVEVRNCRIVTDAGYGMLFGTLIPGKPYGITNTRVIDNVIGSDEYGPVANWPSGQVGNVWAGNTSPDGTPIG